MSCERTLLVRADRAYLVILKTLERSRCGDKPAQHVVPPTTNRHFALVNLCQSRRTCAAGTCQTAVSTDQRRVRIIDGWFLFSGLYCRWALRTFVVYASTHHRWKQSAKQCLPTGQASLKSCLPEAKLACPTWLIESGRILLIF